MLSKFRGVPRLLEKINDVVKPQEITKRVISTKEIIDRESKYAAHNYHPLPVALTKGEGNFYQNFRCCV